MNRNIKSLMRIITISTSMLFVGCAWFGKSQPEAIPLPPRNVDESAPLVLPQIGNSKQNTITESEALSRNESTASIKKRTIIEDRGPGGAVNKITVDNPGNMPNYYIYPSTQQELNVNDNPNRISPPSWQYSW
jgi:hypothetical protein